MAVKVLSARRKISVRRLDAEYLVPEGFTDYSVRKSKYIPASSSSLARQPLVGPVLLKKLYPFVSVEGDFLCNVVPGRSVRF